MPVARKILATAVALPMLLGGCFFYPTTTAFQDPECDVQRHRLELKDEPYDGAGCASSGFGGCIGAALLMGPTTLIISGSIVLVGNFVLGIESGAENQWRQSTGRCRAPAAPQPNPPPPKQQTAEAGGQP